MTIPFPIRIGLPSTVEPILPRGRTQQIIDAVDHLEGIEDIERLAELLVVPPADRIKAVA